MSYVEQVLGTDESVVLKAKVSVFAFIGDFFCYFSFSDFKC